MVERYFYYHLTEFQLHSVTSNNINIAISEIRTQKNLMDHQHEMPKISILCRYIIGFLTKPFPKSQYLNFLTIMNSN